MPARFVGSSRAAAGYCTTIRSACRLLSLGRARNEYARQPRLCPPSHLLLHPRALPPRRVLASAHAHTATFATFAKRRCLKLFMAVTSMNHRAPQASVLRGREAPDGGATAMHGALGLPHGPLRRPLRLRALTHSNVTNVGRDDASGCEMRSGRGRKEQLCSSRSRLAFALARLLRSIGSAGAEMDQCDGGGSAYRSVRVRRDVAHLASPDPIRESIATGTAAPRAASLPSLEGRSFEARAKPARSKRDELDTPLRLPPGSCSILHPEDYAVSINFNKWLDLVRFCDLSRTSPTGFRTQTRLTEFGLTCHPRRVRAHRRVALASIGFVRITCPRSPPRHDQLTRQRVWLDADGIARGHFSSLARSTRRRPSRKNNALRAAERREDPTKNP
jgi:hypothetical protein